jgi:hypothetical protein
MTALLAQQLHDIAPAVDYSLIPTWLFFVGTAAALLLIGWIAWLIRNRRRSPQFVESPRSRALRLLRRAEAEIERLNPYAFSIRVSDILRQYVTEQYKLPLTHQTSVEFLNTLTRSSQFSEEDKMLLDDFLNRCDLIKFARYEATQEDSRNLLEEAERFVRGGALEPA